MILGTFFLSILGIRRTRHPVLVQQGTAEPVAQHSEALR